MLHDLSRISKLQRFYECGLPFVSSTSIRNSKRTSYFCYKLCAFKTRNRSTCVPMKIGRILVYHGKNGTRTVLARPWKVFHLHLYIYIKKTLARSLCASRSLKKSWIISKKMIEKDFMEKISASAGTKTYESTGHDSAELLLPHLLLHASKR